MNETSSGRGRDTQELSEKILFGFRLDTAFSSRRAPNYFVVPSVVVELEGGSGRSRSFFPKEIPE